MGINKGYTVVRDPDTSAKAISKEQPISPKLAREVACMVRGMKVPEAQKVLGDVIACKVPVKLRRYNKRVSHKPNVGPGRYPVKASKAILEAINSAASNADYKGMDSEEMRITTITVARGQTYPGRMPRAQGRMTPWDHETVNIEVVLEEVD